MARRLNVLSRSYKYLAMQYVSDFGHRDAPVITVISYREILFAGKLLKIVSCSPGETGRRKGLKTPG
jgi:hypothetical protein